MTAGTTLSRAIPPTSAGARAVGALVVTGALIGAAVPLARVAGRHGLSPLAWVLATSAVSALVLLVVWRTTSPSVPSRAPARPALAYYAALGVLSIALPNVLLFTAIRSLGAASGSLAYTLPPLLTVTIAALVGLERATPRRLLGIVVGLAGTLVLVVPRGSLHAGGSAGDYVCLALVPVSVAAGNIVRARFWPPGSSPAGNAAGAMLAGVLLLGLGLVARGETGLEELPGEARLELALLALVQGLTNAGAMVLFFWLQRATGPVFTSQVGYIATATGLAFAAAVFGERVSPWILVAGGLLVTGVRLAVPRQSA